MDELQTVIVFAAGALSGALIYAIAQMTAHLVTSDGSGGASASESNRNASAQEDGVALGGPPQGEGQPSADARVGDFENTALDGLTGRVVDPLRKKVAGVVERPGGVRILDFRRERDITHEGFSSTRVGPVLDTPDAPATTVAESTVATSTRVGDGAGRSGEQPGPTPQGGAS